MGSKASANLIGYSTAIIQAILYSTMGIFGKLLYATGLDSSQAMILRMGFTVVYLGALLLIWRKHRLFSRHKETYIQSAFFFLSAWVYLLAVQHMNAGLVTCIFYTFPAVVALLNTIIFKEKVTWRVVMALALSIIGIIFISGILEPHAVFMEPLGVLFSVLACLSFAGYSVIIHVTSSEESSFTSTFTMSAVCLVASLVLFAPGVPGAFTGFDLYRFGIASGFAIIATILPIVLYIVAIKYIGSTKAAILSLVETPASLFLAWLILGETLSVIQLVGAVVIVASVLVITLKGKDAA